MRLSLSQNFSRLSTGAVQGLIILCCSEARFGELLAPYFDDSRNFFVISSDFCHWGSRFSYTFYDRSKVRKDGGKVRYEGMNEGHTCTQLQDAHKYDVTVSLQGEICDSIRWLDLRGVEAISSVSLLVF